MKRSPQHVTGGYLGSSYPEGNADRTSLGGWQSDLQVWQNRRRHRDDRVSLTMASRSRRRIYR